MTKTALITGVTGQDGAYLAKHLLELGGYKVVGLIRRTSSRDTSRLEELGVKPSWITLETFDLAEPFNTQQVIRRHDPDEIYNLAAQSYVHASWDIPLYTMEINSMAVFRFLETVRQTKPCTRFYQAATSEMFGKVQEIPQKETTPFYPRSPYGVAKLASFWYTKNYRESYGMFACSGILFNHESPLRGPEFVTRKITMGLANIIVNGGPPVRLGNVNAIRDWGHASDYVKAMHLMLQQEIPEDYVISSGTSHSVKDFCRLAAAIAGCDLVWQGAGLDEKGINRATGRVLFEIDPDLLRPAEVDILIGDSSKAANELGWKQDHTFSSLVEDMMLTDLRKAKNKSKENI